MLILCSKLSALNYCRTWLSRKDLPIPAGPCIKTPLISSSCPLMIFMLSNFCKDYTIDENPTKLFFWVKMGWSSIRRGELQVSLVSSLSSGLVYSSLIISTFVSCVTHFIAPSLTFIETTLNYCVSPNTHTVIKLFGFSKTFVPLSIRVLFKYATNNWESWTLISKISFKNLHNQILLLYSYVAGELIVQ